MGSIEDEIKQHRFRSESQKAIINLIYTYNQVSGRMVALLQRHGLTMQQYNILRILKGQYPNPSTNNLVKERMLDRNSDVTRLIDRMIKNGLVTRTSCEKDRRRVDILITDKGLALLATLEPEETALDRVTGSLTEGELVELNRLLDRMRS